MNISRADLKRLRLPIAVAAVLLVLGAACAAGSEYWLREARTAQEESRQSRVAAQARVSKFSEEERELRENLVYFERMRERGIVTEQSRLDWIESIAKIKADRKLFEIRYSFDAQKPLDYPGIVTTSAADFVVSKLKVNMLLLHEGDLLNFLADLQATLKAHVSVQHCTVSRIDRGASPIATSLQPRLRAECAVDLVSVKRIKPA